MTVVSGVADVWGRCARKWEPGAASTAHVTLPGAFFGGGPSSPTRIDSAS